MIKFTILNNRRCKISCPNEIILNGIRNLLSYRQKGVEYTSAYQNGWSGITFLMNKKGEFSLGLLEMVKAYLWSISETFEIEDLRAPLVPIEAMNIDPRLESLNKIPRDYQSEIVIAAMQNRRGIIRACTGSGKTLVTAIITAKLNRPSNIYVISLDLLQQFHDLFSQIFNEPIGFVGNGRCDIHRINVVSVWTAGRALGTKTAPIEEGDDFEKDDSPNNYPRIIDCLKKAKLHLFDECHSVQSDTIKSIYEVIDPEYIYGLSGTPFREDGSDILSTSILGDQIIDIPASRLIAEKWLAQPIIKFVPVSKARASKEDNYQSIYKSYIVENDERNELIVTNAKALLAKGYQVLVLFKQINHGKILSKLFEGENIEYEYLSGSYSLEKRMEVKERLLSKQSNLVLTSSIFDVGVDLPTLSGLILAGGGSSPIKTLQRIGRVIRSSPGKQQACVVDFFDDIKYLKKHSKIRHDIYVSEPGFKVFVPNSIKDLK
jgi:superfamily II DNA or RNA helicase